MFGDLDSKQTNETEIGSNKDIFWGERQKEKINEDILRDVAEN